ncbi:MAG: hypothetical protein JSW12_01525 [Deltaproteobacteria bacterium]|nr:MAG: hypothetical protein JSW12_01525 [Deltaproteobacteria bacterium]
MGARERVAKIFDVPDHKRMKFKALVAVSKPIIPPKVADGAPCQEEAEAAFEIIKNTGSNWISRAEFDETLSRKDRILS